MKMPTRHMIVSRSLSALKTSRKSVALAVGFFDGVHRGHVKVIRAALKKAVGLGGEAWILTFDPHPLRVLRPQSAPPLLTCTEHKLAIFSHFGVRGAIVMPFTRATAGTPPDAFARRLAAFSPPLSAIVVGDNWRFGAKASGDPSSLRRTFSRLGVKIEVCIVGPVRVTGDSVSSTRVRRAVMSGKFEAAAVMLGRPFGIWGTVVRGLGRGAELGYPTANIRPCGETLPPPGVYAAFVAVEKRLHMAVMNIGRRPTFGCRIQDPPVIEAHLLGCRKQLYGRNIVAYPIRRLRAEKKFKDPDSLSRQIGRDIADAKELLRNRFATFQKNASWSLHQHGLEV